MPISIPSLATIGKEYQILKESHFASMRFTLTYGFTRPRYQVCCRSNENYGLESIHQSIEYIYVHTYIQTDNISSRNISVKILLSSQVAISVRNVSHKLFFIGKWLRQNYVRKTFWFSILYFLSMNIFMYHATK